MSRKIKLESILTSFNEYASTSMANDFNDFLFCKLNCSPGSFSELSILETLLVNSLSWESNWRFDKLCCVVLSSFFATEEWGCTIAESTTRGAVIGVAMGEVTFSELWASFLEPSSSDEE